MRQGHSQVPTLDLVLALMPGPLLLLALVSMRLWFSLRFLLLRLLPQCRLAPWVRAPASWPPRHLQRQRRLLRAPVKQVFRLPRRIWPLCCRLMGLLLLSRPRVVVVGSLLAVQQRPRPPPLLPHR